MSNLLQINYEKDIRMAGLEKGTINFILVIMREWLPSNLELYDKKKKFDYLAYIDTCLNTSSYWYILSEMSKDNFNLFYHSLAKGQRYLASLNKKERDKYIEKIGFNPFFYDCTGEVPKSLLNKYFYGPDYKFTSEDRRAYKNLIEEVLSTMRADPRYDPDFDLEEYAREHGGEEEE